MEKDTCVQVFLPRSEAYSLREGTQLYTYVAFSFSSPEVSSAPCLAQACVTTKYLMEVALKKEKSPRWLVNLGQVFTSYEVCLPQSNVRMRIVVYYLIDIFILPSNMT